MRAAWCCAVSLRVKTGMVYLRIARGERRERVDGGSLQKGIESSNRFVHLSGAVFKLFSTLCCIEDGTVQQ